MENAGLPRGNIMFSQDQIDFGFKPGNIYVVSYTCAKEPGEMVQEAVSVTLEKMHPCADYAKVWIDGNGEVNTAEETVLQTGDIAQVRSVQGSVLLYRRKNWKPIWRIRREPSISGRQTLIVRRCRS